MKVTIITVCRNAQKTIEETIKSVLSQNYKDIDYVIIDGKSTDKTLEIIYKYKNKIKTIISEPDKGIFDAMNKGIRYARGDIVNFLNAGDLLYSKKIVSDVVRLFKTHNCGIIYGDALLYDSLNPHNNILKCHKHVDSISLARWSICHQAIFAKKSIFDKYGDFNTKYKINADYEWLLRLFTKKKIHFLYTGQIIVKYLIGGISWLQDPIRFYFERILISIKYFNVFGFLIRNLIMKTRDRKMYFRSFQQFTI